MLVGSLSCSFKMWMEVKHINGAIACVANLWLQDQFLWLQSIETFKWESVMRLDNKSCSKSCQNNDKHIRKTHCKTMPDSCKGNCTKYSYNTLWICFVSCFFNKYLINFTQLNNKTILHSNRWHKTAVSYFHKQIAHHVLHHKSTIDIVSCKN